jgi:7-carboxy-7-deazaguanine synthase (Cx14CxxC type)
MTYSVREIYYTLQGEGAQSGRPAVFLRFAGCNLWSGREKDRARAVCRFCDTEFVGTDGPGGGKFETAQSLAAVVVSHWPVTSNRNRPYVVCTGGEPLLQLDCAAIEALHEQGFEVGIETNGTVFSPAGVDWICVSPKAGAAVVQKRGHELKLVYPQEEHEAHPARFETLDFDNFFLQPLDDECRESNVKAAIRYCLEHPQWKLSLQIHKLIGIA